MGHNSLLSDCPTALLPTEWNDSLFCMRAVQECYYLIVQAKRARDFHMRWVKFCARSVERK